MAPFLSLAWKNETVYDLVPTLEKLAALKIAITLWSRKDIRNMIDNCQLRNGLSKYNEIYNFKPIERQVLRYAKELALTEKSKSRVLSFVKPIGKQIFIWKNCYNCDVRLPEELCWSVFGAIDPKKTAQAVVRDSFVSLNLRYAFACAYCLESDVTRLWKVICKQGTTSLLNKTEFAIPIARTLINLWSRVVGKMGGKKETLDKRFKRLGIFSQSEFLEYLVDDCCETALEYFLPKLTPKAKREFLDGSISRITWYKPEPFKCPNKLYFLILKQMNERQLSNVLAIKSGVVLACCLDWPWQDLFMPIARLLQPYLCDNDYLYVLGEITFKVVEGYVDCDYEQIFADFWEQSPESGKKYVLKELARGLDLLVMLFHIGQKENVKLILSYGTDEELENILSYYRRRCHASRYDSDESTDLDAANQRLKYEVDPGKSWMALFLLECYVSEEYRKRKMKESESFR